MKRWRLRFPFSIAALGLTLTSAALAADNPSPLDGASVSANEAAFRKALDEAMGPTADLTVSARTAATGAWAIVSIEHGAAPNGGKPAAWVRYLQGDRTHLTLRSWASADGCPAFPMVLSSAATLRTPAIHIPGGDPVLPPNAPKAPATSPAVLYDVWTSSLRYGGIPDAVTGSMHFIGYANSPPDRWMDQTLTRLEPCWKQAGEGGSLPPAGAVR